MEESPFSELELQPIKTKQWIVVVEKLIAIMLLGIALIIIFSILYVVSTRLFSDIVPPDASWRYYVSLLGFQFLLSMAGLYAGILLLFKKKLGWIFSVAIFSAITLVVAYSFFIQLEPDIVPVSYQVIGLVMILILGFPVYFLNIKEIKQRYSIEMKDYGISGVVFIVLLIIRFTMRYW